MGIAERIADKIVNNHHVVVENRLCSRFRTLKSDCSTCADLCPVDAILISEKGVDIRGGCNDCGVCISACPNGAFGVNGRDDKKIVSEIRESIQGLKGSSAQEVKTFRISCEYGDRTSDLILPCLSRLTEVLLLEPIRIGVSTIEILQPLCKECPSKKAALHIDKVIQQARYLYEMVGTGKESILVRSSELGGKKDSKVQTENSEPKAISRRQFFGSLRTKAMEVATASIPDVEHKDNGNGKSFREAIQNKPENIKRMMLLEAIKDIWVRGKEQQKTSNSELRSGHKVKVPSEGCIVADIEVNSKCIACGVCATLCPAGAINQQWTDNHYNLSYKPALCTNCNVCAYVCMPKAIRIKENASLNLILEEAEVRLFEATKKSCILCRMDFVGGESEICPLCINIHNKQMAAIQNLFKKGGSCERI